MNIVAFEASRNVTPPTFFESSIALHFHHPSCNSKGDIMFKTALLLGVLALFVLPSFAQEEDAKNPPKDQPLKILSKPRPGYTEEARQNNVQGTVKLETTFQSDGKIGDVVCVNGEDRKSVV